MFVADRNGDVITRCAKKALSRPRAAILGAIGVTVSPRWLNEASEKIRGIFQLGELSLRKPRLQSGPTAILPTGGAPEVDHRRV